jgi:U3 small nucleolar RNA-associated protein 20
MRKNIMKITGVNLKKGQKLNSGNEKNMTKVICAIIAGFHFDVPDVVDELEKTLDNRDKNGGLHEILTNIFGKDKPKKKKKKDTGIATDSEDELEEESEEEIQDKIEQILDKPTDDIDQVGNQQSIYRTLTKSFLPALFKHLKETDRKSDSLDDAKIRIHVAVAIVRLLRKTNNRTFNDGFHKLVRNIISCLRSKQAKFRDKARDALVQVNLNVSSYLFHITVDELQKGLRKGYQRHVKSFTLHHVLDCLVKEDHVKIGQLDHCLDSAVMRGDKTGLSWGKSSQAITSILMDELFGKLGYEKDLEGTSMVKIKETKSKRALQTYELLTQYIDFENSFIRLVTPVLNRADSMSKPTHLKKCEEILSIISSNILKNTSVKSESLLLILYAIMKKGINKGDKLEEEEQVVKEEVYKKPNALKQKVQTFKVLSIWQRDIVHLRKPDSESSSNLLLAFALSTLKKAMGFLSLEDYKDRLDSFTKLYVPLMKSNDNRVVINTLHVLGKCIKLSLPNIQYHCRNIINNLFILFGNTSDSEFLNSCFKCATEMIKHMKTDLTEFQTTKVIEVIKANLEHYQMQANVYSCLKALVEQKALSPSIYDLVEIIGDKMVTHTNKSTRTICAQIYIQFLVNYPLEERRVEQHVNHLIKNLTYVGKDGRLTVLEVIEKVVNLFPTHILDKYAFLLFLSMILRTVNESSPE